MYINHNQMATNAANTLTSHYSNLATSTQRLSSGLRVNSAADDAAGLAIRELMRADISALQQGVRNANDGISLLQTADGALGIIDEKLIRMKELAEQAATGTYDSTQRLMIESEYQAMASEITRIANATDFNGIKLLNGNLSSDEHDGSQLESTGKMKIHFGTSNDSAEDYYYIKIAESTAQAFGLGNASTAEDAVTRGLTEFKESLKKQINEDKTLSDADKGAMLNNVEEMAKQVEAIYTSSMDPMKAYDLMSMSDADEADTGFLKDGKTWVGNERLLNDFLAAGAAANESAAKIAGDAAVKQFEDDLTAGTSTTDTDKVTNLMTTLTTSLKAKSAEVLTTTNGATFGNDAIDNWTDTDKYQALGETMVSNILQQAEADFTAAGIELDEQTKSDLGTALQAAWNSVTPDDATNPSNRQAIKTALDNAIDTAVAANGSLYENAKSVVGDQVRAAAPKTPEDAYNQAEAAALANGDTAEDAAAAGEAAQKTFEDNRNTAMMDNFWTKQTVADQQKLKYTFMQATAYNLANSADTGNPSEYGLDAAELDFAKLADVSTDAVETANKMLDNALKAMSGDIATRDFAGFTIQTQEDAQHALDAINAAIVTKDKTRADIGALQNRLENTVSNLTVQAENLQAAESRISDVDVATEMTNFVRNQILTQSAVAMLGQANSMPQMAMQLIG